jgi:hypothetical protein
MSMLGPQYSTMLTISIIVTHIHGSATTNISYPMTVAQGTKVNIDSTYHCTSMTPPYLMVSLPLLSSLLVGSPALQLSLEQHLTLPPTPFTPKVIITFYTLAFQTYGFDSGCHFYPSLIFVCKAG